MREWVVSAWVVGGSRVGVDNEVVCMSVRLECKGVVDSIESVVFHEGSLHYLK